jgi:hypothetical protein
MRALVGDIRSTMFQIAWEAFGGWQHLISKGEVAPISIAR